MKIYSLFTPFYAQILLAMMHFAGLLGLNWQYTRPYFEALIAFNLLANMAVLLYFHYHKSLVWEQSFYIFLLISFFTGFFIEVLGVHTKIIFGEYWYIKNMGFTLFDVPLLIGINWCMLVYCVGVFSHFLSKKIPHIFPENTFLKSFLGASLMTFLDYWIEPFAIYFNMWAWKDGVVPLQNYIGWFFTAYFLMFIFHFLPFNKKNPVAIWLLIFQFLFFFGNTIIKN